MRYSLEHSPPDRKRGVKKEQYRGRTASEGRAKILISDRCESIVTADAWELIPESDWAAMAKTAHHLRREERFRFTLDQDGVGSCAAESAAGLKGALDERVNLPKVVYNPWSIYWKTSGGVDRGSVIGHNVEYLRDHGVVPEEVWARSHGWRAEPGGEAKRIAKFFTIDGFFYIKNIAELVTALLKGYDVHGGYSGHAIVYCQYMGGGKIKYKNSWGSWGQNGFGTLSLNKVYFPYGCYAYKSPRMWKLDEWSPRHNQDALELAAWRFSESTTDWSDRGQAKRNEAYQHQLARCGLDS